VAGFGQPDLLYLTDLSFVSGATSTTWSQSTASGGVLAVTNGAATVDINLLGHYVTANFHVSAGNGGGTLVSDPPVGADQPSGALTTPHQP
jgi:hypothetical protein